MNTEWPDVKIFLIFSGGAAHPMIRKKVDHINQIIYNALYSI